MADAPERIWALPRSKRWVPAAETADPQSIAQTYIRADLVDELVKALEHARPLVVSYGHTQGDRADYHAELVAPIDAALTRIKRDGK